MKKVGFYTLGCKVNQYETQAMTEMFKNAGYEIVNHEDFADVYVINTCTVTSFGDKKSRQVVRRASRTNPDALIAVVGCYSQISPDEVSKIPGVDIIAGTSERNRIVELVEKAEKEKKIVEVSDIMNRKEYEETGFISYSETTRAFVKIQEGCENFCTYCIIPYTRGPIRSRSFESILKEVNKLADNGFKEIVLTGINLSSYGKDIGGISIINVIEEISKINAIKRIRLGSIYQELITSDFLSSIKGNEKMCPHFHVSMQSGSDTVLKRMNRKYTSSQYEEKIKLLRSTIPDISITTDVIVGFPGETEKEFQETYDFLDRLSLTRLHVFKYSPRKGTPAASFPNQVGYEEKEKRSNLLLKMSGNKENQFCTQFLSREMEVLFEQEDISKEGYLEGHTANFIKVFAKSEIQNIGQFKMVRVEKIENGNMLGSVMP